MRPTPPPPGPALLAAVAGMRAVPTRRPWRDALLAVVVVVVSTAAMALVWPRPLVSSSPVMVLAMIVAVLVAILALFVPRPGQVLSSTARMLRAIAVGVTLTLAAQAWSRSTESDASSVDSLVCLARGSLIQLPATALLLRLAPERGAAARIAVGVAGGGAAVLALSLECPFAGATHLAVGHLLVVAVSALASTSVAWLMERSRRDARR